MAGGDDIGLYIELDVGERSAVLYAKDQLRARLKQRIGGPRNSGVL